MPTVVRLLNSPLLSVDTLVFDAEIAVDRGQDRDYTRRRVAAGATLSEHSRLREREWELEGAVSASPQLQNLGRPGANVLDELTAIGTSIASQFAEAIPSKLDDFEDTLVLLMEVGDEVEVVTKAPGTGGRFRAVVTSWRAVSKSSGPESGNAATYRLRVLEVARAGAKSLAQGTIDALGLNGSATTSPAPSGSKISVVSLAP